MSDITYIDEVQITNKRVLVRVDYNVPLDKDGSGKITDDTRIKSSLPTLQFLLEKDNTLILMSHLGKPKGKDMNYSMRPVAERLQTYFSDYKIVLIEDFTKNSSLALRTAPVQEKKIYLLENTRFYEGEKKNDPVFAKQLAGLADVFVSDAFGSVHRAHASVVGVASYLPSYGGLLLKKEVQMIGKVFEAPQRPLVSIIGGAKISSKIGLIEKLMEFSDYVLIGGAMTNNFFKAQGKEVGKGLVEDEFVQEAKRLWEKANEGKKNIILPADRRIGNKENTQDAPQIKSINEVLSDDETLDIGSETEKHYAEIISQAKTILWNGPVGYFENPQFAAGSVAIFNAIVANPSATSVLGGGDTLSLIKHLKGKETITHISTGGGAMLELIEKGTLPGLEALKR